MRRTLIGLSLGTLLAAGAAGLPAAASVPADRDGARTASTTAAAAPKGLIAFATDNAEDDLGIAVMNADGTGVRRVYTAPTPANEFPSQRIDTVRMSADGTRIVFSLERDVDNAPNGLRARIIVMNVDGSDRRALTSGHLDREPAFSPDGRRIVFSRDDELHLIRADGSSRATRLLRGSDDSAPAFSPDGKTVVFFRTFVPKFGDEDEFYSDAYLINADGTGTPRRLTRVERLTASGGVDNPSFSPDGRAILFELSEDGQSSVWVMRKDGGRERRIASAAPFNHIDPAFSPNGKRIVFSSLRYSKDGSGEGEQFDLFRVDRDGSNRVRIAGERSRNEVSPSWARPR